MIQVLARALGAAVLASLVGAVGGPLAAANAADSSLGWLRIQPGTGKTDEAVQALTQGACPAEANAVVVKLAGPGIKESAGNLVGVTQLEALDATESGQLWIPLQFAFDQWFLVNIVTPKAGATYTVSAVCRDLARSSKTYGSFVGSVVFDGKGRFKGIGETAKPFNTTLKSSDPFGAPVASATPSGPGSTDAPSASAEPGRPSSEATGSGAAAEPDPTRSTGGESIVAAPTRAAAPADSTARNVILGGSLLLLVGIGVASLLGRLRGRSTDKVDAGDGVDGREKVDVL